MMAKRHRIVSAGKNGEETGTLIYSWENTK
jgi:hypothetical protein